MTAQYLQGDCREVMRTLEAESVDAIVTDPPYGLTFMGKDWDNGVPGEAFWREALRVAKPGAHLLAFGGTRTFHRLVCAIEDAGWEIRDTVMWIYGSGFPKSLDVSKAIDRMAGAEREITGQREVAIDRWTAEGRRRRALGEDGSYAISETAPATAAARQWNGWGTALKPAWEPIIVARKPLIGTVAANVLAHGTGAINIDACRIGSTRCIPASHSNTPSMIGVIGVGARRPESELDPNIGRWPANVIHDGSDEVLAAFPQTNGGGDIHKRDSPKTSGIYGAFDGSDDRWSGYADTGSAARFFYTAKASQDDRNFGCFGIPKQLGPECGARTVEPGKSGGYGAPRANHHPTVKPTDLMRYLCRLVTPPGGLVLDPFMGSGSTGIAAKLEHFRFIGIEQDAAYIEIARNSVHHTQAQVAMFT